MVVAALPASVLSEPASARGARPSSVAVGAGYNEQLANINNSLLAKSGVRWARAYVNLARNFWMFGTPVPQPPPTQPLYPITGVAEGNIFQPLSNVSSDADVLAVAALDQLINTKTLSPGGAPLKIILSLKHDFSYPYAAGAQVPPGQFPDVTTVAGRAEAEQMVAAIEMLLTTNNRGNEIDILVTGNEPMFEIQPNTDAATGLRYQHYLDYLVGRLNDLKIAQNMLIVDGQPNHWDFMIFVGALNSPLDPLPFNQILPAILEVARTNPLVDGIDLHEHVLDTSEVRGDIGYVKDQLRTRATPWKIISTEFSIIRLFQTNMNTPVKPPALPLSQFINNAISRAASGRPMSKGAFLSYFASQPWYPRQWFREMMDGFEAEEVYAVTYGLEEAPRYPWSDNILPPGAMPWVLNGVYNATLLGRSPDGFPVANPLVEPQFREAVKRMR